MISADEKSQLQALRRRHPDLPPGPERTRRVEFEYTRGGTVAYLAALDVHHATEVVAVAVGDGQRRARSDDGREAGFGRVPVVHHPVCRVAQVADRRHPGLGLTSQVGPDRCVELLVGGRAGCLQAARGPIRHEVGMGVDQTGQQGAGVVLDGDAVRWREAEGLDADDAPVVDEHGGPAREEALPVEGVGGSPRVHAPQRARRAADPPAPQGSRLPRNRRRRPRARRLGPSSPYPSPRGEW